MSTSDRVYKDIVGANTTHVETAMSETNNLMDHFDTPFASKIETRYRAIVNARDTHKYMSDGLTLFCALRYESASAALTLPPQFVVTLASTNATCLDSLTKNYGEIKQQMGDQHADWPAVRSAMHNAICCRQYRLAHRHIVSNIGDSQDEKRQAEYEAEALRAKRQRENYRMGGTAAQMGADAAHFAPPPPPAPAPAPRCNCSGRRMLTCIVCVKAYGPGGCH